MTATLTTPRAPALPPRAKTPKSPDALCKLSLKLAAEAHVILLASGKTRARPPGWLVARLWDGTTARAKHEAWGQLPTPTYEAQELVTIYVPRRIYDDIHAASHHHDRAMGWLVSTLLLSLDPDQRRTLWTVQPPEEAPQAEVHP